MKNVKLNQEFNLNYPLFKRIFSFPPFKKNEDNKRSLSKRSTDSTIENNDHNLKKVTSAFAIAIMLFALGTGNLAQAQIEKTIQYEPALMEDGTYEFDIGTACKSLSTYSGVKNCNLVAKNGMSLRITFGPNASAPYYFNSIEWGGYAYAGTNGSTPSIISPILSSTHPMKSASISGCPIVEKLLDKNSFYPTFAITMAGLAGCSRSEMQWSILDLYGSRLFSMKNRETSKAVGFTVFKVHLSPYMTSITPILITNANTLLAYFRSNLDQINRLQGNLPNDYHPMTRRLYVALYNIVKMMSSENEENPLSGVNNNISKLPITHELIRENSRLIMVLSEVIIEMLQKQYPDTTNTEIKSLINSLTPLSTEIRTAFGWDTGTVGSGSKALASVAVMIEIYLKSLEEPFTFYSQNNPKLLSVYNRLKYSNSFLKSSITGREQGDAGGMKAVIEFRDTWNSNVWQDFLTNFMKKQQNVNLSKTIKNLLSTVITLQDFKRDQNDQKFVFKGLDGDLFDKNVNKP